jgi:hypothetical protein
LIELAGRKDVPDAKLTSSQHSGIKLAKQYIAPYLDVALFEGKSHVFAIYFHKSIFLCSYAG